MSKSHGLKQPVESRGMLTAKSSQRSAEVCRNYRRSLPETVFGTALLAAAILASTATHQARAEQTVYKCSNADGSTVFSPTPCGKGAKEIGVPKSAGGSPAPAHDAIREISDSVSDSRCREDARRLYVEPDTSAIARAQAEITQLQHRSWTGNPRAAQQMASDDATRVVGLRNVIATERTRVDAQRAESRRRVDEALAKCDAQKQARVEASQK